MIFARRNQLHFVDYAPPARDPAGKRQGTAQVAQVDGHSLEPHDAIFRHDAYVIGKDVRVILQDLYQFRAECLVRLSARGDDDFLQGRRTAAANVSGLRQGSRPDDPPGHSQRRRQE